MTKPIFTVGIPDGITKKELEEIQSQITKTLSDYYVLVYVFHKNDPEFNAYYEKDFNEVKFEELKEIIRKNLSLQGERKGGKK